MTNHESLSSGSRDGGRVLGALALELTPGSPVARDALSQDAAGRLAPLIGRDLAKLQPAAADLELVLVGAHYDPVELLRPEWPLHRELGQLAANAPKDAPDGGRVIAFGAHEGRLPGKLAPDPDFAGGPLRLVPFLLQGNAAALAEVGEGFEHNLVEIGMADAATALLAQELFGVQVEHARYLTLADLLAMTSMQYEFAGLAPLWPLLEAALLAPTHEEWLDAPPEPLAHFADAQANIALFSPAAWRDRYAPEEDRDDDARLERGFARFQARQRQFAAVLGAHGVPVTFCHCGAGDTPDV